MAKSIWKPFLINHFGYFSHRLIKSSTRAVSVVKHKQYNGASWRSDFIFWGTVIEYQLSSKWVSYISAQWELVQSTRTVHKELHGLEMLWIWDLYELRFCNQEATNKPMIAMYNVKCQLELCNGHVYNSGAVQTCSLEWWVTLHHLAGESYLPDYMVPTGKFGGGGTMFWGDISWFVCNPFSGLHKTLTSAQSSTFGIKRNVACEEDDVVYIYLLITSFTNLATYRD